jgi:D-sedoheptulose 7-phosphate isomerase
MSDSAVQSVRSHLLASAETKRRAAESDTCVIALVEIATAVADALRGGRKVLVCGNGGSAADSQHIATELVVRLRKERARRALPAIALSTDTSLLTACSNDFSFDEVFARQVEAHGHKGDVLIGISTSGNSPNVIRAFQVARDLGLKRILFGGGSGGKLAGLADLAFLSPSNDTSHIQEVHLASYHAFLFLVEDLLFGPLP